MAAFPKGSDIATSPSEGCEGIRQSMEDEMRKVTEGLGKMSLGSPKKNGGSKSDSGGTRELASSPSGSPQKGRGKHCRPNARGKGTKNLQDPFNFADSEFSPSSNRLDSGKATPFESTRQKRKPSSPLTRKARELSNLSLNLGQPSVW